MLVASLQQKFHWNDWIDTYTEKLKHGPCNMMRRQYSVGACDAKRTSHHEIWSTQRRPIRDIQPSTGAIQYLHLKYTNLEIMKSQSHRTLVKESYQTRQDLFQGLISSINVLGWHATPRNDLHEPAIHGRCSMWTLQGFHATHWEACCHHSAASSPVHTNHYRRWNRCNGHATSHHCIVPEPQLCMGYVLWIPDHWWMLSNICKDCQSQKMSCLQASWIEICKTENRQVLRQRQVPRSSHSPVSNSQQWSEISWPQESQTTVQNAREWGHVCCFSPRWQPLHQ